MLIAHIGLHKTGSTYLQREVFPALLNVQYLEVRGGLKWTAARGEHWIVSDESMSGLPWDKADKYAPLATLEPGQWLERMADSLHTVERLLRPDLIVMVIRPPES